MTAKTEMSNAELTAYVYRLHNRLDALERPNRYEEAVESRDCLLRMLDKAEALVEQYRGDR